MACRASHKRGIILDLFLQVKEVYRPRDGADDVRHLEDLPAEVQEDQPASLEVLVPADHQRPPLPPHAIAAGHPPRPEVRQHLHHRPHRLGQDRGPRPRHPEEQVFRQVRHR